VERAVYCIADEYQGWHGKRKKKLTGPYPPTAPTTGESTGKQHLSMPHEGMAKEALGSAMGSGHGMALGERYGGDLSYQLESNRCLLRANDKNRSFFFAVAQGDISLLLSSPLTPSPIRFCLSFNIRSDPPSTQCLVQGRLFS
jgi:hypothetical protein